jgi:hypothetical protein
VQHCRRVGARVAENVLGVVELSPFEPTTPRHLTAVENFFVRLRGLNLEELPDAGPELLYLGHRPLPQLLVVTEREGLLVLESPHVAGDVGVFLELFGGFPEQDPFGCFGHMCLFNRFAIKTASASVDPTIHRPW